MLLNTWLHFLQRYVSTSCSFHHFGLLEALFPHEKSPYRCLLSSYAGSISKKSRKPCHWSPFPHHLVIRSSRYVSAHVLSTSGVPTPGVVQRKDSQTPQPCWLTLTHGLFHHQSALEESRWTELTLQFRRNNFVLNGLTAQSLLELVLQTGISCLKTPSCYDESRKPINDCPVGLGSSNQSAL
jgi:hypothetical protein